MYVRKSVAESANCGHLDVCYLTTALVNSKIPTGLHYYS